MDSYADEGHVLLDPNTLSDDGTVALTSEVSRGRPMAGLRHQRQRLRLEDVVRPQHRDG